MWVINKPYFVAEVRQVKKAWAYDLGVRLHKIHQINYCAKYNNSKYSAFLISPEAAFMAVTMEAKKGYNVEYYLCSCLKGV
jgi:hypothetical protein